jgi:DNA-binding transcriptional MerR regulator
MKIELRKFRIGALAERLQVERFVIRFWEKEFNIKPHRSSGRQRFYTDKDLEKFFAIKELLYEKGFTIAGAKKHIKKHLSTRKTPHYQDQDTTMVASLMTTMEPEAIMARIPDTTDQAAQITAQILALQKQLIKLRELL